MKHNEYSANVLGLVFVMAFKKKEKTDVRVRTLNPQAHLQASTMGEKQHRSNHSFHFTQTHIETRSYWLHLS